MQQIIYCTPMVPVMIMQQDITRKNVGINDPQKLPYIANPNSFIDNQQSELNQTKDITPQKEEQQQQLAHLSQTRFTNAQQPLQQFYQLHLNAGSNNKSIFPYQPIPMVSNCPIDPFQNKMHSIQYYPIPSHLYPYVSFQQEGLNYHRIPNDVNTESPLNTIPNRSDNNPDNSHNTESSINKAISSKQTHNLENYNRDCFVKYSFLKDQECSKKFLIEKQTYKNEEGSQDQDMINLDQTKSMRIDGQQDICKQEENQQITQEYIVRANLTAKQQNEQNKHFYCHQVEGKLFDYPQIKNFSQNSMKKQNYKQFQVKVEKSPIQNTEANNNDKRYDSNYQQTYQNNLTIQNITLYKSKQNRNNQHSNDVVASDEDGDSSYQAVANQKIKKISKKQKYNSIQPNNNTKRTQEEVRQNPKTQQSKFLACRAKDTQENRKVPIQHCLREQHEGNNNIKTVPSNESAQLKNSVGNQSQLTDEKNKSVKHYTEMILQQGTTPKNIAPNQYNNIQQNKKENCKRSLQNYQNLNIEKQPQERRLFKQRHRAQNQINVTKDQFSGQQNGLEGHLKIESEIEQGKINDNNYDVLIQQRSKSHVIKGDTKTQVQKQPQPYQKFSDQEEEQLIRKDYQIKQITKNIKNEIKSMSILPYQSQQIENQTGQCNQDHQQLFPQPPSGKNKNLQQISLTQPMISKIEQDKLFSQNEQDLPKIQNPHSLLNCKNLINSENLLEKSIQKQYQQDKLVNTLEQEEQESNNSIEIYIESLESNIGDKEQESINKNEISHHNKVAIGNASKNILKAFHKYTQQSSNSDDSIITSLNRMYQRNTMSNLFLIKIYLNSRYNKLMRDFIENFAHDWLVQSKVRDLDTHLKILNELENNDLSILKTKKKKYQRKKIMQFNTNNTNKKKPKNTTNENRQHS